MIRVGVFGIGYQDLKWSLGLAWCFIPMRKAHVEAYNLLMGKCEKEGSGYEV
jgi:hypothetical protein